MQFSAIFLTCLILENFFFIKISRKNFSSKGKGGNSKEPGNLNKSGRFQIRKNVLLKRNFFFPHQEEHQKYFAKK